MCNPEQKKFIDQVMKSVNEVKQNGKKAKCQRLFFLTGDGGTGKTFVYNVNNYFPYGNKLHNSQTLISGLKSQRSYVQVTASTGIAAELLIDGSTLHMKFRINNDIDGNTAPKVDCDSTFAEIVRRCEILIVDEVSMQHKHVLMYVDRLMREVIRHNDEEAGKIPFAGKVFFQLLFAE